MYLRVLFFISVYLSISLWEVIMLQQKLTPYPYRMGLDLWGFNVVCLYVYSSILMPFYIRDSNICCCKEKLPFTNSNI